MAENHNPYFWTILIENLQRFYGELHIYTTTLLMMCLSLYSQEPNKGYRITFIILPVIIMMG